MNNILSYFPYILIAIIILIPFSIIILNIVKKSNEWDKENPLKYLEVIFTTVVDACQTVLTICNLKIEDYDSTEDYMKALISYTIDYIIANADKLNIKAEIIAQVKDVILNDYIFSAISHAIIKQTNSVEIED